MKSMRDMGDDHMRTAEHKRTWSRYNVEVTCRLVDSKAATGWGNISQYKQSKAKSDPYINSQHKSTARLNCQTDRSVIKDA